MVKMLTAAIGEFSSAGDENVKNLRQIEKQRRVGEPEPGRARHPSASGDLPYGDS